MQMCSSLQFNLVPSLIFLSEGIEMPPLRRPELGRLATAQELSARITGLASNVAVEIEEVSSGLHALTTALDVDGQLVGVHDLHFLTAPGQSTMDTLLHMRTLMPTVLDAADTTEIAPVVADGAGPIMDAVHRGWRYVNSAAGQKINWYFFGNTVATQGAYAYNRLECFYVRLRFPTVAAATAAKTHLFLALYTHPRGDGQDRASWYRSRLNYGIASSSVIQENADLVLFLGPRDPSAAGFVGLTAVDQTVQLSPLSGGYTGPAGQTAPAGQEVVKLIALATNSGAPVSSLDFTVLETGSRFGGKFTRILTYL